MLRDKILQLENKLIIAKQLLSLTNNYNMKKLISLCRNKSIPFDAEDLMSYGNIKSLRMDINESISDLEDRMYELKYI